MLEPTFPWAPHSLGWAWFSTSNLFIRLPVSSRTGTHPYFHHSFAQDLPLSLQNENHLDWSSARPWGTAWKAHERKHLCDVLSTNCNAKQRFQIIVCYSIESASLVLFHFCCPGKLTCIHSTRKPTTGDCYPSFQSMKQLGVLLWWDTSHCRVTQHIGATWQFTGVSVTFSTAVAQNQTIMTQSKASTISFNINFLSCFLKKVFVICLFA